MYWRKQKKRPNVIRKERDILPKMAIKWTQEIKPDKKNYKQQAKS
jgi:hypothetical protein